MSLVLLFLPQKTADFLNYGQRQRCISSSPSSTSGSTLCNWLFNRQFQNENSQSLKGPDKCVQSETVVPLSPQNETKVKSNVSPSLASVTAVTTNGGIITSSGSSLKIRVIVIYMKGLAVD